MPTEQPHNVKESLSERAYQLLRTQIIGCTIEPGSWVTESQLAEQLGVGKTPTREALRRLAAEGFATPAHRRGYQVTPITVAHVREVFEAFGVLVPEVAVIVAARATPDDKRRLAEATRRWTGAAGEEAELEFPWPLFIELCRNPTIVEMASRVVGHLARMLSFARFHGALASPEFLAVTASALGAMERGDADDIRRAVRREIEETMRLVIDALHTSPSLMTTPVEMSGGRATSA